MATATGRATNPELPADQPMRLINDGAAGKD